MGNPLLIEPGTLTLGELAAIQELTDLAISETLVAFVNGSGADSAGFILALQLIAGVRDDPTYTLIDAGAVLYADLAREGEDDASET
jgi:hypothetical protein